MEQNITLQEYFKIIQYFYQNTLNILVLLQRLICGNIESTTKSRRNFALTFVHYHVLPSINFNGYYL